MVGNGFRFISPKMMGKVIIIVLDVKSYMCSYVTFNSTFNCGEVKKLFYLMPEFLTVQDIKLSHVLPEKILKTISFSVARWPGQLDTLRSVPERLPSESSLVNMDPATHQ